MQEHLDRIAKGNSALGAFVEVWPDTAIEAATAIDRARARGDHLGPMAGVPVALKDNLLLAGRTAACGSRMLANFRAPYTATAVERLLAAGAVVLGRTAMDEFGMGSSTETSAVGPCRNPWDQRCVPGGSSGGAAAAVAAGFCAFALGSDTGGSVRQPAALCGISGLKPTYGRISRFGLVAYASSLDCVGVLAHSAADLALGGELMGYDPRDATSRQEPVAAPDLGEAANLDGLRIGVLADTAADADTQVAVERAAARCRDLGARLATVQLPQLEHAVATYYLLACAEAASNLARYDGIRFGLRVDGRTVESTIEQSRSQGFGDEVQLRILLGTFALQHGYKDQVYDRAAAARQRLRADFAAAFAHCDVLLSPTTPAPAWRLGSVTDPLVMYQGDALTVPASLAGLPALSIPCGHTTNGLPIGVQLTAAELREDLLLRTAHVYQQHTDWHRRRPPA